MFRVATHRGAAALVVVGAAVALGACGSSQDAGGSATQSGTTATSASSDVAAARAIVAPFIGKPSPFPVSEPLTSAPKAGATIAYMDSGTPISGLLEQLARGATKALGVNLDRIKTGSAADTTSAAYDTVVAKRPAAVISNGISPELYAKQLKQLQAAKIPVVASGVATGARYGLSPVQSGPADNIRSGKILADYVVAELDPKAKVVLYDVPEISLTTQIAGVFTAELRRVCSACSVRVVHIPIATLGNKAPASVVSDLQAHSDTTVAVFGTDEIQLGLPQALKAAGITIKTLGYAPGPTNLQYLKDGKETAVLAYDLPVLAWTQIDQAVRQVAGQALSGPEAQGLGVVQFLTQKDITFDPAKGWTGYPDFAQRFSKLWGVGQ